MSRSISESLEELDTSLDSCQMSLQGKEVEVEAQPKVSELPALIDSIEAGGSSGGGGFNCIENVTLSGTEINNSRLYNSLILYDYDYPKLDLKFTPKIDNAHLFINNLHVKITPNVEEELPEGKPLEKGTEYHLTADSYTGGFIAIADYSNPSLYVEHSPIDVLIFYYQ